ncbi:MAG: SDR family NAD(P)-dependent oxidoreductase [Bacteroidales bacterium]|nr:SDR family NAD(P)-dependent oxidoreductase [Bacteroidales bacterium]
MKTALVTGADGFIGSHLTEHLLAAGYKVRALSQYNSFNNWGWLEQVRHRNLEVVCGDVRYPNFCKEIARGVDVIFHLAALIAIPYSYIAPDSYVDTNIKGTLNICQAARACEVKRLIVTSTSEVYGTALTVPISETHPKQPQSPYSATKIGADAIALSFYNSFDLPVVIARPFNTYGPRQSARAIIPTIISQIAAGERVIKVGDMRPTRDFNFVSDTCKGFIAIAETPGLEGMEINIATSKEISMGNLFNLISELMEVNVTYEVDSQRLRPQGSEVMRLMGDNTLITTRTSWQPRVDIREGLKQTIEWFTNPMNLAMYKPGIYNQ